MKGLTDYRHIRPDHEPSEKASAATASRRAVQEDLELMALARFARLMLSIQRSHLSRNAKAVLAALCGAVDWSTWQRQFPTWWLAIRVGVSEDTVARALPELIDCGVMIREELPRSSPIWQVIPSAILQLEPVRLRSPHKGEGLPGADRVSAGQVASPPAHAAGPELHSASSELQNVGFPAGSAEASPGNAVDGPQYAAPRDKIDSSSTTQIAPSPHFADTSPHPAPPFLPEESSDRSSDSITGRIAGSLVGSSGSGSREMLEISSRSASGRRRGQDDVKLSQEPSPHPLPAVLPADVRRFLDIIRRWSGNEAPRGAAWRVQPDADREWYQREILESGLAEGLDMIAVLTGWDEFLEMAARGQKRCRFPVNFKNSLRNQVSMWQQRQSGRTAAHASTATTSETNKHADGSSTAGVARKLPGGRDPDGARFPTREQWHVEADGRRKSLSYADHLERAKRSGTEAWSRERFDAFVRKNGLEPVD